MGKGGRRRRHRRDTGGWPRFRHNEWTYEGGIERAGAFARGWRLIRERGGHRGITNRDLVLPLALAFVAIAAVVVAIWAVAGALR